MMNDLFLFNDYFMEIVSWYILVEIKIV